MKFVGSIEFEIWTMFAENINDVTMTSSPIRIFSHSNINLPSAYLNAKLKFILIGHKRSEIQRREVNRIMKQKWILRHCDLDIDPRLSIAIGFEPVR